MHIDDFLKQWMGQTTTGHGAAALAAVFMAYMGGQLTATQAVIGLIASLVLVVWPENVGLSNAVKTVGADVQNLASSSAGKQTMTDIEGLIAAYRVGLTHGAASSAGQPGADGGASAASVTPAAAHAPAAAPAPPVPGLRPGVGAVVGLLLVGMLGLGLTACGTKDPHVAAGQAIAAADTAYAAASALEQKVLVGAVPGVKMSASDLAAYKLADQKAYDLLVQAKANHDANKDPTAEQLADLNAAVTALSDILTKMGAK